MRRVRAYQAGFTLIEIMLVILIIGILLAVATATFLNQQDKAQDTAVETSLTNAAHAATYVFTSNGKNVFPSSTISQLAHSEPELNITCSQAYMPDQVSAYFKDTGNCSPSNNAHVLDLRAVSKDGTDYVEQLDYTGTQRQILRLKGNAETTTNLIPNSSFEDGTSNWNIYASAPTHTAAITSAWADSGNDSLHITSDIPAGKYVAAQPTIKYVLTGSPISARATVNIHSLTGGSVIYLYVFFYAADGSSIKTVGTNLKAPATGVDTLMLNGLVPPTGAETCTIKIQPSTPAAAADGSVDFDVDSVMMVEAPTVPAYFDGSYPDAYWNGEGPDATSTGYAWGNW